MLPPGHHRHEFHELLWMEQGHSRHLVDFREYILGPAEVLFMPRGSIHRFDGGEDCCGGLVLFDDDFLTSAQAHALRSFRLFDPLCPSRLCTPTCASTVRLLQEIRQEHAQPTLVGGSTVLQSLLVAVLHKLEATCLPAEILCLDSAAELNQRFSALLEAHFREQHSVGFYATALHCSPRQLAAAIRAARGYSTQQLILERLLLEAKRYLGYTDHRVSEIAFLLGFDDPAYFSRLFRLKVGQSAEVFRKQLVEKSM